MIAFGCHALGFGDDDGYFFEVGADGVFKAGLVQTGGGMIHSDADAPVDLARSAMDDADFFVAKEFRHRMAAQSNDDRGIDGGDLPVKIVVAGSDLYWLRVAVARGAAFDNVGDKDVRSFKVDARQEFV